MLQSTKGNAIVADILSELRQSSQFVAITGGGVLLLRPLLADVLAHCTASRPRDPRDSDIVASTGRQV